MDVFKHLVGSSRCHGCMLLAFYMYMCSRVLSVYIMLCFLWLAHSPRPIPMMEMRGVGGRVMFDGAPQMNMAMANSASPPPKSELAPVTHVRKIFPETWLWKTLDTSYVACWLQLSR